jgi:hypothetical protein
MTRPSVTAGAAGLHSRGVAFLHGDAVLDRVSFSLSL